MCVRQSTRQTIVAAPGGVRWEQSLPGAVTTHGIYAPKNNQEASPHQCQSWRFRRERFIAKVISLRYPVLRHLQRTVNHLVTHRYSEAISLATAPRRRRAKIRERSKCELLTCKGELGRERRRNSNRDGRAENQDEGWKGV
jgi:hypothetical protein